MLSSVGHNSSSYRDRTGEFHSVAERLRKSSGATANGESSQARTNNKNLSAASVISLQSEFNKKASRIGLSIHQTTQKLDKLAKLAKRTSMFDDPAVEIQELTAVIKQDITALNSSIEELQKICESRDAASRNKHTNDYSTTVVDSLKSRLMSTTKNFKDVLTLRTESLKVHENRRQLFTSADHVRTGVSRTRSSLNGGGAHAPPPPWASNSSSQIPGESSSSGPSAASLFSDENSSKTALLQDQQLLVNRQDSYMRSRTEALQNVEATIVELGTIFQNLAIMVQQQGEVAIRIDQDLDDTLTNVEGAHANLLKYFNRISSNRWLIIKIFLVLMVFLLIFVVFVA